MKATASTTQSVISNMAPPNRSLLLLEVRAALDFARMIGPLARASVRRKVPEHDSLTAVVPGFGTGDSSTLPLRRYLKRQGFRAEGWGLAPTLRAPILRIRRRIFQTAGTSIHAMSIAAK